MDEEDDNKVDQYICLLPAGQLGAVLHPGTLDVGKCVRVPKAWCPREPARPVKERPHGVPPGGHAPCLTEHCSYVEYLPTQDKETLYNPHAFTRPRSLCTRCKLWWITCLNNFKTASRKEKKWTIQCNLCDNTSLDFILPELLEAKRRPAHLKPEDIEGLWLIHQTVSNLLVALLSLKGAEQTVPYDEDTSIVFIETPLVRAWGVRIIRWSGCCCWAILSVLCSM